MHTFKPQHDWWDQNVPAIDAMTSMAMGSDDNQRNTLFCSTLKLSGFWPPLGGSRPSLLDDCVKVGALKGDWGSGLEVGPCLLGDA